MFRNDSSCRSELSLCDEDLHAAQTIDGYWVGMMTDSLLKKLDLDALRLKMALDQICLQSTAYTCAPAACATLLAAWGIEKSEHEMAQLCLCVPNRGTNGFDTYRGLRPLACRHPAGHREQRDRDHAD